MSHTSDNEQPGGGDRRWISFDQVKFVAGVFAPIFFFGGWCATLEWRTHTILEKLGQDSVRITDAAVKSSAIEMWKASTEGSRWTAQDHAVYAAGVTKEVGLNQQRISVVEAGISSIKDGQASMTKQIERLTDAIQHQRP